MTPFFLCISYCCFLFRSPVYISPFPSPLLSFYSSRLTVASHIPRILCSFCSLTAVCSREDPRDISSVVLFPSSVFIFYLIFLPFCSLSLLTVIFFFFPVSCLFLTSLLTFCIPYFSFSFVHLFFILPPLNLFLFYFLSLKIITSFSFLIFSFCFCFFLFLICVSFLHFPTFLLFLSPFPKVTISCLFYIPIFYFILLRTHFCSPFLNFFQLLLSVANHIFRIF